MEVHFIHKTRRNPAPARAPFLEFGQDMLGRGDGLGILVVGQVVAGTPIAILHGGQGAIDRDRMDMPAVATEQIGEVGTVQVATG